jgi:selenocysteine-specific elongation factor
VILGTAGHIDHGKTALVKALTGVDTDRLPEERRRGITIELGFAPLILEGVGTVGVVDVPGHEAFVRTMVAGATGVDMVLVVIAADEGVMPQTREHLAILEFLGVRHGVVALSKRDLVDDEWLELVREDVRGLLAETALAAVPIVAVSAATGEGLEELRAALARVAAAIPGRSADDVFRLQVDRAFTVAGTGTVVTGTVWSGQLRRDAAVRVLPSDMTARVRGLQSHGSAVEAVAAGARAAVNVGGVDRGDVQRGVTLVTDPMWAASTVIRADVTLMPDAPTLSSRTRVRLHHGTRDAAARLVAAGGSVAAASTRPVRVVLDDPLTMRAGDRFVLRTAQPVATIGGGVVSDPAPSHRRARPWPSAGLSAPERLSLIAQEAGKRGVPRAALPVRLGVAPRDVDSVVASAPVEVLGDSVFDRDVMTVVREGILEAVDAHHSAHPLEEGASVQSVRTGVGVASAASSSTLVEEVLRRLVADGTLDVDKGLVRRHAWAPRPSEAERELLTALEQAVGASGREPPTVTELARAQANGARGGGGSADVASLLRLLERRGRVVRVESDRYYGTQTMAELTSALRTAMKPGQGYTPSELRDILSVSRKYLIPLLEFFDRRGVTERRGDSRVFMHDKS